MFSVTPLSWFAVGALIALVTFCLEGGTKKSNIATLVFSAIVVGIVSWILAYVFMTSFSPWLVSTWVQAILLAFLSALLYALVGTASGMSFAAYSLLTGVVFVVGIAASAPIFHAQRYGALMAPEIKERDAAVPLIDQTQARLVTDKLAIKRAAEILASAKEEGLGSRTIMGEPWGNKINGTMYWAIPLEHASFWKWLSNGTTPGYIAVSQMNEMNTKFIQDKPLRISTSAWFDDNVYRHLFNRGFKSQIMGEAILTIDEEWNPHWLVPMSLPQVGFGGDMPVSWSLVDAQTGEIRSFDNPDDAPEWVDRLFHQAMVAERFDDWGCWSQGVGACLFSGNDVVKSTAGINVTIDAALDIVYYSGTQFENNQAEGATSGFYTANARTGKITFYRRAGITEDAAKDVMRGAFANFDGYEPADMVLLSLPGGEAYFSIIVDGAGSRKAFALVMQTNRNVFGKGDSIQAALTDYARSMRRAGRDAAFEPGKDIPTAVFEGKVLTIKPVTQGDRTAFYLSIDSLPGKIVEVAEEKIGDIVVTEKGANVRITTDSTDPGIILATSFDNLDFELVEGGIQAAVDSRNEAAESERREAELLDETTEKVKSLNPDEIRLLRKALETLAE